MVGIEKNEKKKGKIKRTYTSAVTKATTEILTWLKAYEERKAEREVAHHRQKMDFLKDL